MQKFVVDNNHYRLDFEPVIMNGHVYFIPSFAKHRPACQAFFNGGYYEPGTHKFMEVALEAMPGNVIHAGAFFGDMLPNFAKHCKGTLYAFEPVLENYVLSKLCITENNIENVALFNTGLGEASGIAKISFEDGSGLHKGGASNIAGSGQVISMMTIDSLNVDKLVIIQLDVEGFELPALKGAQRSIETHKPIILIEDNSKNCAPYLTSLNYTLVGELPTLSVWAHIDNVDFATEILSKVS